MPERFDFVLGLGSACSCTQALRAAGLQLLSFPLDWVSGGDLKSRTSLVIGGFADWMTEDGWARVDNPGAFGHDTYVNRRTGLVHPHDFEKGRPPEESYPSVKAKYDRRVARLMGLLASSKQTLLVWIGDPRDAVPLSAGDVEFCLSSFRRQYPKSDFSMLAFDCAANGSGACPSDESGDGFRLVRIDYRSRSADAPPWAVDSDMLAGCLRGVAVRDYRMAEERRAFAKMERRREMERFGARNAFDLAWTRLQFKVWRHLRKTMLRRGMKLD